MSRRLRSRIWIDPQDFSDLRKHAGLTRLQAAQALDVTARTIQNWETGGARIPWMAYRMLRILRGYALPGVYWEGWTVRDDVLFSPDGRAFPVGDLYGLQYTFAFARLWRQMYSRAGRAESASSVVPFPDRRGDP